MTELSLKKQIAAIAVPISLQSLFQASLSVIDQLMIGRLGTLAVAAVGLGSRFSTLFTVTLAAVNTAVSILLAQAVGAGKREELRLDFSCGLALAGLVTLAFLLPSVLGSDMIISLYTADQTVIPHASVYLMITAAGFLPLAGSSMISALLRNLHHAQDTMTAGIFSVLCNTALNALFIFGCGPIPALGVAGAAWATTITRILEFLLLSLLLLCRSRRESLKLKLTLRIPPVLVRSMTLIAGPVLANEFLWGLGETVMSGIYGRISTASMAAMTLTYPIQNLAIGLFSGLASAAAILCGNSLGAGRSEEARARASQMLRLSLIFAALTGLGVILTGKLYASLFQVDAETLRFTSQLLSVFGLFLAVKVGNMVLAGGILRSGGNTLTTMLIDMAGTWGVGIPLGLISAFLLQLPVPAVYFLITLEECVRLLLGWLAYRKGRWSRRLA